MRKIYLLTFILFSFSFSDDKLYFLPAQNKEVKKEIRSLISNAQHNIDLAIYNIRYSKFIDELNKAAIRGVAINIFYEKKDGNFHKNIKFYKTSKKMHTKIAIFDGNIVLFGSANWKKESYKNNYEVVNIINDENKVKKFNEFFKKLKEEN